MKSDIKLASLSGSSRPKAKIKSASDPRNLALRQNRGALPPPGEASRLPLLKQCRQRRWPALALFAPSPARIALDNAAGSAKV
jgi:hypothetical protein